MGVGIILLLVCVFVQNFWSFSPFSPIGDVVWVDRVSAFQQNLVQINQQNRAIIKVDNVADIPFNEKRNSVFVTSLLVAASRTAPNLKYDNRSESHRKTSMVLVASGS